MCPGLKVVSADVLMVPAEFISAFTAFVTENGPDMNPAPLLVFPLLRGPEISQSQQQPQQPGGDADVPAQV